MDETKEKILIAAERLFGRKGLGGVTTREICREAGVNGALVNYHFGSKEKLYGACLRRTFENGGGAELINLDKKVKDAKSWKVAIRVWVRSIFLTMHGVEGQKGFASGGVPE